MPNDHRLGVVAPWRNRAEHEAERRRPFVIAENGHDAAYDAISAIGTNDLRLQVWERLLRNASPERAMQGIKAMPERGA